MYTRHQLAAASCNLGPCPAMPAEMGVPNELWDMFAAGPWTIRILPRGKYSVATATAELLVTVCAYERRGYTILGVTLLCNGHAVGHRGLKSVSNADHGLAHSFRGVLAWLFDALAAVRPPASEQQLVRAHFRL